MHEPFDYLAAARVQVEGSALITVTDNPISHIYWVYMLMLGCFLVNKFSTSVANITVLLFND